MYRLNGRPHGWLFSRLYRGPTKRLSGRLIGWESRGLNCRASNWSPSRLL